MTAQIIEKAGKKEFVVIPYGQFLKMQEALDDHYALKALGRAKHTDKNKRARPLEEVARELGRL